MDSRLRGNDKEGTDIVNTLPVSPLPSPNHDSREGHAIDMLVLHYTGMASATQALERLCNPQAKVSAHYVVDEDGTIYRLVEEDRRAWHAGVSAWRGYSNINQRSIGVEIVNPGHEFGYRPFPEAQMVSLLRLCADILSRHDIPARNVVGHSDVAPARKEDPGELFNWARLSELGIGLWPAEERMNQGFSLVLWKLMNIVPPRMEWLLRLFRAMLATPLYRAAAGPLPSDAELAAQLGEFGYDTTDLPRAITAFQRHYAPNRLSGKWNHQCALRLASLRQMV